MDNMSSASVMGKYAREYGTQKKHFSIARLQQYQGNIKRMGPLDLNHLTHHDIREFLLIINTAGLHLQGTDHQFVCSFIRGCHKQHSTSVYLISDSESEHIVSFFFYSWTLHTQDSPPLSTIAISVRKVSQSPKRDAFPSQPPTQPHSAVHHLTTPSRL